MRDHEEIQLPGPPPVRALLAAAVLLLAGGWLLGWVPFNPQVAGFGFVLIAAALLF